MRLLLESDNVDAKRGDALRYAAYSGHEALRMAIKGGNWQRNYYSGGLLRHDREHKCHDMELVYIYV